MHLQEGNTLNINQVKTATKIGTFNKTTSGPNLISIEYHVASKILTDESPRIYLITSDDVIKKIGGSASKGGIKATMSFYLTSQQGSPGVPRFVIHHLIRRELDAGKKVELFMITSPRVMADVNGLFGTYEVAIASFKEMEDICKNDYFKLEKKYPEWNFQENNTPYPEDLAKAHVAYHDKRLGK